MVRPDIRIVFEQPASQPNSAGKVGTVWDVNLTILSSRGTSYSPDPIVLDDSQTQEAEFNVVLPSDSLYSFEVTYVQSGTRFAEGSVLYWVDRETSSITIPVAVRDGSTPGVAFVPSTIRARAVDADNMRLQLRYYGSDTPVSGLAGNFEVEGIAPDQLNLDGPTLIEPSGQTVGAAWQWPDQVSGTVVLGTISPSQSIGSFCIEAVDGEVRAVSPAGLITRLRGARACVEIIP
jgi:hypothetical protein